MLVRVLNIFVPLTNLENPQENYHGSLSNDNGLAVALIPKTFLY